jgi:streptogramin lyase/DNA-directed RNA polymerase subunit RPC12/RpoP
MAKAQVFQCPNCGASLDYDGGDDLTVRCPYCDSSVIVPDELRDKEPELKRSVFGLSPDKIRELKELGQLVRANRRIEAIKLYREIFGVGLKEAKDAVAKLSRGEPVQVSNMTIKTDDLFESALVAFASEAFEPVQPVAVTARRAGTILGLSISGFVLLIIAAIVVSTLVIGAAIAMIARTGVSQTSSTGVQQATPVQRSVVIAATPTPVPFARVVLTFGSEGKGPGLFTDARSVAVDGEGTIYVGEYREPRVQVFDASGEFISLWMVEAETPLRGLDVDRQGTVYVVHGGEIFRYEGATGELLGQVEYAEGWGFGDVAVMADGGLVASWYRGRDDIVRFDAQGDVVQTIQAAISGQSGDSELDTHVAVDGLGNIYALGSFNRAVFKFTRDGKFVTRFGSHGDGPGQFAAPHDIAVDGQGRVYVSDFHGIQVFDPNGRYLEFIEVDGPNFGITFNDQNELFVAARHQVIKYVVRQPGGD